MRQNTLPMGKAQYQSQSKIPTQLPMTQSSNIPRLDQPNNPIPLPLNNQPQQSLMYQSNVPGIGSQVVYPNPPPDQWRYCPCCSTELKTHGQESGCDNCGGDLDEDPSKLLKHALDKILKDQDALDKLNNDLKNKLKKASDDRNKMLDDLNKLQTDNDNLKQACNDLEKEKEKLNQDLDGVKKINQDLKKNLDQVNSKPLEQENDDLKRRLQKALDDRKKMLADLAALERMNNDLKGKLDKANDENNLLKGNLDKVKRDNDNLKKICDDLNNDKEKLKRDLDGAKKVNLQYQQNNQLRKNLDKVNAENPQRIKEDLDRLNKEKKEQEDHLKYLHQQLEQALKALALMKKQQGLQPSQEKANAVNPQLGRDNPLTQTTNNNNKTPTQNGNPYPNGQNFNGQNNGYINQPQAFQNHLFNHNNGPGMGSSMPIGMGGNMNPNMGPNMNPNMNPNINSGVQQNIQPGMMGAMNGYQSQVPTVNNTQYDELLRDNQRMKRVIDQLNGDLKVYRSQRQ